MAEVDLREIIVAFHEKGWNLYAYYSTGHTGEQEFSMTGPIDNLVPGTQYSILPAAEDPTNIDSVLLEVSRAKRADALPRFYSPGEGKTIQVCSIKVKPAKDPFYLLIMAKATPSEEDTGIPLENAAQLLREYLSTHERGQDGS